MRGYLFTSESVTEGHPDKLCDAIADAVLDAALAADRNARVACEVMAKGKHVTIAGEITAKRIPDVEDIARGVIRDIGYIDNDACFSADNCEVRIQLEGQSPDIAMGVNRSLESKEGGEEQLGAGDQGMMFGFACDETPELMPMPLSLAHRLCRELANARKTGELPYLRPDGKAQVTLEYAGGRPVRVDAVVVSAQHDEAVDVEALRRGILEGVIKRVIPAEMMDAGTRFFINPTGRFTVGGPEGDSGLTGRKIIVDTYGGAARHGGGSFSGKDPTKVDRSAAYMARCIAKNVVAAGLAKKCELQLAYAIGVANPVSVNAATDAGSDTEALIERAIMDVFDMRPSAIIRRLDLCRPIYRPTACYGHMGRDDLRLPWEKTDMADALKQAVASLSRRG